MTATIKRYRNGVIKIRSPYDEGFVADLKDVVPWQYRQWDGALKLWIVQAPYAKDAIDCVRYWYAVVRIIEEEPTTTGPSQSPPNGDPFRTLHLLPSAPPQLIHAAYKTLARINHPDLGGDVTTMQRINAAYDKIKES